MILPPSLFLLKFWWNFIFRLKFRWFHNGLADIEDQISTLARHHTVIGKKSCAQWSLPQSFESSDCATEVGPPYIYPFSSHLFAVGQPVQAAYHNVRPYKNPQLRPFENRFRGRAGVSLHETTYRNPADDISTLVDSVIHYDGAQYEYYSSQLLYPRCYCVYWLC